MNTQRFPHIFMRPVGTTVIALILFVLAMAACESDDAATPTPTAPAGWSWSELGEDHFTIALPPGWTANPMQGIDSFIGEIRGDGSVLSWDLGWYSSDLPFEDDPAYTVAVEEISGREAKLVRSSADGAVGVYFPFYEGGDPDGPSPTRLTIFGEGLAPEQIEVAIAMFRTIR